MLLGPPNAIGRRESIPLISEKDSILPQVPTGISLTPCLNGTRCSCPVAYCADLTGTIAFIDNSALDNGGAVSIVNPVMLHMGDAIFAFNSANSGGAVRLTSTSGAITDFERCRFEGNFGQLGGALRLDGEGHSVIRDSLFLRNIVGETLSSRVSNFISN